MYKHFILYYYMHVVCGRIPNCKSESSRPTCPV